MTRVNLAVPSIIFIAKQAMRLFNGRPNVNKIVNTILCVLNEKYTPQVQVYKYLLPRLKLCITGMGFEIIYPHLNSNFISLSAS